MVNAQSVPGTMAKSIATTQNASTELVAMNRSPRHGCLGNDIADRVKGASNLRHGMAGSWKNLTVDGIDRKILALLQENGRLTVTELATRVGLSVSPCHRRLRDLERSGAIRGYRAVVDGDAIGLAFQALVLVTMRQEDRDTLLSFEEAVARIPNVLQAQRLFGDPDYLLRIITADLAAYQRLVDDTLAALPGIQRLNSTLVMKHVVDDRPLPI
jgi:DNA-binding Lrp family transcriptional regulator